MYAIQELQYQMSLSSCKHHPEHDRHLEVHKRHSHLTNYTHVTTYYLSLNESRACGEVRVVCTVDGMEEVRRHTRSATYGSEVGTKVRLGQQL